MVTFKVVQGGAIFDDVVYLHMPYRPGEAAALRVIAHGIARVGEKGGRMESRGGRIASAVFAEAFAARGAPAPEVCTITVSPSGEWRGADEWVVDVPRQRVGLLRWNAASGSLSRSAGRWSSFADLEEAVRQERLNGGVFSPAAARGDRKPIRQARRASRPEATARARRAAQRAVPGVGFTANMGTDDTLDVSAARALTQGQISALDRAVSALGWRSWRIGDKGIAFKPAPGLDKED